VPWEVEKPKGIPKNTMIVGTDVFHNIGKGQKSVVGFCVTIDNKFTRHYSTLHIQESKGQEIIYCMEKLMKRSLLEYQKENKCLPEMIIFYRDGVGESQFDLVMQHEIPSILESFKSIDQNYSPKFAEIIVTKRIDDRFFFGQKKAAINPCSGTIISSKVVSKKYFDYFLVA
jgi:aubergine-like protein